MRYILLIIPSFLYLCSCTPRIQYVETYSCPQATMPAPPKYQVPLLRKGDPYDKQAEAIANDMLECKGYSEDLFKRLQRYAVEGGAK